MVLDYLEMRQLIRCSGVSKHFFLQCSKDYLYSKFDHDISSSLLSEDDDLEDEEAEEESNELSEKSH